MKFTIKTIGCKVNTYESNKIKTELIGLGLEYIELTDKERLNEVDLYIINTCSVTSIADKKSRQMIHQAISKCKNAKIVATGCSVEANHSTSKDNDILDNSIIYIGNDKKNGIVNQLIRQNIIMHKNPVDSPMVNQKTSNIREFIKIQDGCNQFCTYCIIPYLRGKIKSRDEIEILDEIKKKIECGTKEVVLTGIHLSSYGLDKENLSYECDGAIEKSRKHILHLVKEIAKLPIERIRLGSLEPRIINECFLKGLQEEDVKDKFCANFCLSLQSGCDKTLLAMNRHYTTKEYENSCNLIRKIIPNALITTDVIVGFPGETNIDFEVSLAFVKKMRFYNPNIFPYSRRHGTKADTFANQVTSEEKHKRAIKMIDECDKITKEIECEYNKVSHHVLIEEEIIEDGVTYGLGYTKEYVREKVRK